MPVWSSALVSSFLLFCAAAWMVWHLRSWRQVQRQEPAGAEFDFRRRQFRRRMQTSAMLGLLAVAILGSRFLPDSPTIVLIFVVGVLLLIGWVVLLALVDVWATKHHFGRLRQGYLTEEVRLQAEFRRIRAVRGNGKAQDEKPGDTQIGE